MCRKLLNYLLLTKFSDLKLFFAIISKIFQLNSDIKSFPHKGSGTNDISKTNIISSNFSSLSPNSSVFSDYPVLQIHLIKRILEYFYYLLKLITIIS